MHKNDKEAGYTLTSLADDKLLDQAFFGKPDYSEILEHSMDFQTLAKTYCRISHDIEK